MERFKWRSCVLRLLEEVSQCGAAASQCMIAHSYIFEVKKIPGMPLDLEQQLEPRLPLDVFYQFPFICQLVHDAQFSFVLFFSICVAGWRSMARQGLFGGIFLAVIEGLGIVVSKWMTSANQATMNDVGSLTSYGSSSARDSAPLPAPENILLVNHRPGELLDSPELSLSTDTGIGSSEFLDDSQEFVFEDDFGEKFQDGYE